MEMPRTTREQRPTIGRSHTALPYISPEKARAIPSSWTTNPPQHTSRRLHLHALNPVHHHHHIRHSGRDRKHYEEKSSLEKTAGYLTPVNIIEKVGSRAPANVTVSPNRGRRTSPAAVRQTAIARLLPRVVRPEDVEKEKQRAQGRDEELRASLNLLSDLAHNSTRSLDITYYSILEKVAVLRSTIKYLQDLTSDSSKLHRAFQEEVSNLELDVQTQIDGFTNFNEQQRTIEDMERKIKKDVKHATVLSGRLEQARNRVELWEKRENEWQARTSKRLKASWICLVTLAVLIVVLLVFRFLLLSFGRSMIPFKISTQATVRNGPMSSFAVSRLSQFTGSAKPAASPPSLSESGDKLHLFDEL